MAPAVAGLLGLTNGWHSDKTGERRLHTAIPLLGVGSAYLLLTIVRPSFPLAMTLFALGGLFVYAYYPAFWAMPTMILSRSAAAATFGLINAVGHMGGFFGPYIVGWLNDRTHSLTAGFSFIGVCYLIAAGFVARLAAYTPRVVRVTPAVTTA
jgi:nitrate/nitrite transporter NarK